MDAKEMFKAVDAARSYMLDLPDDVIGMATVKIYWDPETLFTGAGKDREVIDIDRKGKANYFTYLVHLMGMDIVEDEQHDKMVLMDRGQIIGGFSARGV